MKQRALSHLTQVITPPGLAGLHNTKPKKKVGAKNDFLVEVHRISSI